MVADNVLLQMLILLVAALVCAEICVRIGQPAILGQIIAGVIVGPSLLSLVEMNKVLFILGELGVVFLLFKIGLETRLSEMRDVGPVAIRVGALGFVFPLIAGLGIGYAFQLELATSAFLAASFVATSVGITAAVIMALGRTDHRASRTVLGAAVVDDVLAMLLLAIVTASVNDELSAWSIVLAAGGAMAFVGISLGVGGTLFRAKPDVLHAPRFDDSPLLPAVVLCLGLAVIAQEVGLAAIIGAFIAGVIVAETNARRSIEHEVEPFVRFLAPFFFAGIGLELVLEELLSLRAITLLIVATLLAIATKFVGAWIGARSLGRADAGIVAIGMVPRGEVGVIIAGIGAAAGVLNEQLFAIVVGMSILTTVVTPGLLRRRFAAADAAQGGKGSTSA